MKLGGDYLSPLELQGKYTVALGRIGGETGSEVANQRPIYERNSQGAERQAIAEAANALTALWKIRRADKT